MGFCSPLVWQDTWIWTHENDLVSSYCIAFTSQLLSFWEAISVCGVVPTCFWGHDLCQHSRAPRCYLLWYRAINQIYTKEQGRKDLMIFFKSCKTSTKPWHNRSNEAMWGNVPKRSWVWRASDGTRSAQLAGCVGEWPWIQGRVCVLNDNGTTSVSCFFLNPLSCSKPLLLHPPTTRTCILFLLVL